MSVKQRIAWIDILKFLGMYFVVIGHASNSGDLNSYRYYIYAFHMPLFFLISGMAFNLQIRNKIFTLKEMIINKINGLVIPYFILSFLVLPIWYLTARVFSHSESRMYSKIIGIFYSHQSQVSAFSNALWFIPTLFLTTIAFFAILKWAKEDERILTLTILAITSIGYTMSLVEKKIYLPWHLDTVPIALFFFLIGYLFIKHLEKVKIILGDNKRQVLIVLALLPLAFLAARYNVKISMAVNTYGSFIQFIFAALAFSLILFIISMKLPNYIIMNFIGRNTIVYLAFHAPIFRFLSKVSNETQMLLENHPIITGSLVFIILIPIAYIFERFFPYLIGRSKSKLFKI